MDDLSKRFYDNEKIIEPTKHEELQSQVEVVIHKIMAEMTQRELRRFQRVAEMCISQWKQHKNRE